MIDSWFENLAIVWASIDRLCSDLPAGQWDLQPGARDPTSKDQLSHLVDYEARALGRPAPGHEPGPLPHVKNEMGRANSSRGRAPAMSGAAVLDEFRRVTAERLAQLRRLTLTISPRRRQPGRPRDRRGPAHPAGDGQLEPRTGHPPRGQGSPGHTEGPAVEEAVAYFSRFLPYLVGKRAAAPDGAKVVFRIGARPPVAVEVAGGRGRLAADPGDATVDLAVPVATFAALVGGRADVPANTVISGDQRLAQARAGVDGLPALTPGPVPGSC